MEERIVIRGTPQKNKIALIVMIAGIVLMFVSILVAGYILDHGSYLVPPYWNRSFGDFFTYNFFEIDCYYGYMMIVGFIATIVGIIIKVNTEKCEITVYIHAIIGKLTHGKGVVIPMNQITAINPNSFNGVSISSIGNTCTFYCFENRDEIIKAISYILANPPQATVSSATSATGETERLKKLKELFDNGVLTQEEFDEKKREILKS